MPMTRGNPDEEGANEMSANLDRKEDGTAAIMYRRSGGTPWHGEGFEVNDDRVIYSEEAVKLGGMAFTIEKRPIFRTMADGSVKEIEGSKAIVRTDRDITFAIASDAYEPFQQVDAYRFFDPMIDEGLIAIDTSGSLRDGRDTWMLGRLNVERFPEIVKNVFGDEIVPYILANNNNACERRLVIKPSQIRTVCDNTLQASLRDRFMTMAVSVVHRGDSKVKMVEAAERLFEGITKRYVVIAERFQAMKETFLTVEQFTKSVLDVAVPLPEKKEGGNEKRYMTAVDKALDRRNAILAAWDTGKGHKGDRSAWEAYNGLVEVVDHNVDLYPTIGGSRVRNLMDGPLGETKSAVLESVLALIEETRGELVGVRVR